MNRRTATLATASLLAAGLALGACVTPPPAQSMGLKQRITGVWTLSSNYNIMPDGKRIEPQGPDGKGMLILDPSGRFMWHLARADMPRYASNNRLTGTAAEYAATARGTLAYFGTYTVDEAAGTITMRIEYGSYPNFNGTVQTRTIKLENDQMTVVNAAGASGGTAYVIWKRPG